MRKKKERKRHSHVGYLEKYVTFKSKRYTAAAIVFRVSYYFLRFFVL